MKVRSGKETGVERTETECCELRFDVKKLTQTWKRTKECNHTNYWILRKNNKVSSIQSFIMKNPIQTSYELLWNELKNKDRNSSIQNTIRRIIENYFKMLGGYKDDDLIQQFKSKEEQEIFRSLICWINDGSHNISDDLFIEAQNDTVEKYLNMN